MSMWSVRTYSPRVTYRCEIEQLIVPCSKLHCFACGTSWVCEHPEQMGGQPKEANPVELRHEVNDTVVLSPIAVRTLSV